MSTKKPVGPGLQPGVVVRIDQVRDTRLCRCGWELPWSVIALAMGRDPSEADPAMGVYVYLQCPSCDEAHTFINGADPNAQAEYERQRKGKK